MFEHILNGFDIIKKIRHHIVSTDNENDVDSFYITNKSKKIIIRVATHQTNLWTWHERKDDESNDMTRISIVFEDEDTYSDQDNQRQTPLQVTEFVYKIDNTHKLSPEDVKMIIENIKQCLSKGRMYQDPTGKLTYFKERLSI